MDVFKVPIATKRPCFLNDWMINIAEANAVRVIDVFVDDLDLSGLDFKTHSEETGRPAYHPTTLLKLYVYGYLNRCSPVVAWNGKHTATWSSCGSPAI